jgi:adenylate kinase family enzyme
VVGRVFIYGVTGSGKTTFARKMAERIGLPWYAVDELTWEPGWIEVPPDEQRRRIAEICATERWILDAAYGKWLDVPLARAELIVALDYPRWRSLSRLIRRTLIRAIDRTPVCNGNTESFRQAFSRDSIVVWHFRSYARKRARIAAWAADPDGPAVIRLRTPSAARRLLANPPPELLTLKAGNDEA